MHSASVFKETKKVSRTEIVEILTSAKETVFTCTFHTKVDDKHVLEVLKSSKNISKDSKELSKAIVLGKQMEMVGHLTRSEQKLGRSSVIDLNAHIPFKQIDHRTVQSLIYKNVKYIC